MSQLGLIPIFLSGIAMIAFITTYCIAVSLDHVEAFFPYISMTGTSRPESAIFGQFLTIIAVLAFVCIYIRYMLVKHITRGEMRKVNRWNKAALYLGFIICIGITIVANFQATTVLPVHLFGAIMVFGVGWIYTVIQTYITYTMHPQYNSVSIARVRLSFTVLLFCSLLITFISGTVASSKYSWGSSIDKNDWKPDDPGFVEHVISAFGEWVMAVLQMLYFLTYTKEFFKIDMSINADMRISHLDEQPVNESLTLTQ